MVAMRALAAVRSMVIAAIAPYFADLSAHRKRIIFCRKTQWYFVLRSVVIQFSAGKAGQDAYTDAVIRIR
jgi:hypothetical protein